MKRNGRERGHSNKSVTPRPRRSKLTPRTTASGVSHFSAVEEIADNFVRDIVDDKGRIRLGLVRRYFKWRQLEEERGRQVIVRCYEKWVKCSEYLWFTVINKHTGEKVKEVCRKCSKRGNDVYRWRLDHRLGWIDELEEKEFFNGQDRNVRGETTRMLFVVLTYNTKRCSCRKAWETINDDWNRWITAVRKKYGKVKYFKSFEAFKNGYPHVNAVLLFENNEFEVSFRDKNKRFRILRKEKDWLDSLWHSNVDVQACYSTGAFGYVKKYMLKTYGEQIEDVKGISEDQAELTVALLWLFRKQSFSLSGGMQEVMYDLIGEWRNSNSSAFQTTVEGESLYEFELIGVVTFEELMLRRKPPPNARGKWSFELPLVAKAERKLSGKMDPNLRTLFSFCPVH